MLVLAALLVPVLLPSTAEAGNSPLVANSERSVSGAFTPVTCPGAPDRWQCLDEAAGSGDDYFSVASTATSSFELTSATLPGGTNADSVTLHIVARTSVASGCTVTLALRKSDGSLVAQFTSFPSTSFTISGGGPYGINLTQADVNGLYMDVTATVSSGICDIQQTFADISWPDPPTISGTVDNTAICNGSTAVIGIAVNSTKHSTVPCTAGTGAFTANPAFNTGDTITVYYDGVAGGAANAGATWVKAAASSATLISGVALNRRRYRTEARAAGTPISNLDVQKWDNADDPDIYLAITATTDVTDTGGTFEVGVNTYSHASLMNTPKFWVRAGATIAGAAQIIVNGSGTGTCDDTAANRPFCVVGTYSHTGTVRYASTAPTAISGGTYNTLQIYGTGAAYDLGAPGSTSITASSIYVNGTNITVDTSTHSPTVNVAGAMTIFSTTSTLQGSGTGTITVGGDLTGGGHVNLTGGTVDLRSAGAAQQVNASGTLPGTAWRFATLVFSTSAGARTVTIPATSREIRASTLLQVGTATDAATTTVNASALTQPITVTGNFVGTNRGSFTAPPLLVVHGNFTLAGTLTAGTGTIQFAGAGASTINNTGAIGDAYNVLVSTPSKVVELTTSVNVYNNLTLTGSGCATPVTLRSNVGGSSRSVIGTGPSPTATISYASLRDISFSGPVTGTNSGDLGGNTNFTATGTPCAAPATLHTDNTNASAGTVKNAMVDGRTTFKMSFANATGVAVDRHKTEVTTSVLDGTVRGLWALDGNANDRSATANNASPSGGGPAYVAGATNFGQAASFDGIDDRLTAPANAGYDTATFTVEGWVRMSDTADTSWSLISRNEAPSKWNFWLGRSGTHIRAMVTSNGGTQTQAVTLAAPWIDDTWHHLALTVDSTKNVRLYIDGVQYGSTATYPGTLDILPAEPVIMGSGLPGQIDDVQFTAGEPDPAKILGYARTKRPHAQSLWQSTNFATTGNAIACTIGARCPDITYTGPDIRQDGARYYTTHQARTEHGLWSSIGSDWFETSDGISVSTPGSVTIPSTAPGYDALTTFSVTTTCTNATGCLLDLSAASDTVALVNTSGTSTIPRYTTAAPSAPATWASGSPLGLGFTVVSSTSGKDTTRWGTGATFTAPNLGQFKFTGANRTAALLQSTPNASETTVVGVRLNAPLSTAPDTYTGTIQLVAMDAP